jgi:hypothetical protein
VVTLDTLASADAADSTTGTVVVRYENAPADCGWQLLITVGNGGGQDAVPSGSIAVGDIDGPEGATASVANGAISILVPAPPDGATSGTSGTIEITTVLAPNTSIDTVLVEAFTQP